jgi:FkbM family methyltransferase
MYSLTMNKIKKLVTAALFALGYSISPNGAMEEITSLSRLGIRLRILGLSPKTEALSVSEALNIANNSKSQLGQDVLALSITGVEKKGFFVEFGATNGVDLSNTHLLEKEYGWSGILCEPAKRWHEELLRNRDSAIDFRCVYSTTADFVPFVETQMGELSTLKSYVDVDANRLNRKLANAYEVETVSLAQLLLDHSAPEYIDFLSIDTEGSEFEILKAFDFNRFRFGLIVVEHNYTENRGKIRELLIEQGYSQIHRDISAFDDWYVG